tara:strand:+ start:1511 stop:2377 length:867 start_codon:yes stop_codon:yes gene_type:complete
MDNLSYNGLIISKKDFCFSLFNRGIKYGDSFFDTVRCSNGFPNFWEEHYYRIASSLLLTKMKTPENFSFDNFRDLIVKILDSNKLNDTSSRVRITFYREGSGYYLPKNQSTSFIIETEKLKSNKFELNSSGLKVSIYRENFLPKCQISNVKTNNRIINVISSIYADENRLDDVILINSDKNIVETSKGNIFIVSQLGNIITPPLEDGCINGVIRSVLVKSKQFPIIEKSISFPELINAKEIFLTNVIQGVNWIGRLNNKIYDNKSSLNKTYTKDKSTEIINYLNAKLV